MNIEKEKTVKILRTSLMVAAWFCMGLRLGVQYATIPDQRTRLNTTTDMISYAFAIGNIGSLAGPPLSALSDRFQNHGDLYFSGLITIYGLIFALKPVFTQLWIYTVLEVCEGIVMSACSPVGYSLILAMWGKDSQAAVQIFGLGWSTGGIFGPLIAVPFVSVESEETKTNDTLCGNVTCLNNIVLKSESQSELSSDNWLSYLINPYDTTSSRIDRYPDNSRIELANWIVAICFFVVASLIVVMYVVFKPQAIGTRKKYSWKEILYPAKWADGDTPLGIKVFIIFMLAFMFYTGTYYGPSTLLATYASDSSLGFDNQEAAVLSSAYSFSGSMGRVVVIGLSKWVPITPLMCVLCHGTVIGGFLLAFVGTQSKTALWVCACTFAVFYRPIWGSIYTWTNNYIVLLAALLGIQGFLNSLYSIFIVSLQGYLYEENIDTVFYTTAVYASLLCIVYYCMVCLGYGRITRHDKIKEKEKPDVFVIASLDDSEKKQIPDDICFEFNTKL